MRFLLIIFISLLTTLAVYGQSSVTNKLDSIKHTINGGKVMAIIDSGFTNKAEAKNLTVNGLKEGKWLEYVKCVLLYPNESDITHDTNLACSYRLVFYKSGKPCGIIRTYYMNGKLLDEKTFTKGKVNGIERGYYINGVLQSETPYNMGIENGIRKTYYENGKIESETPFTHGHINGIDKEYYENGNLEYEYPRTHSMNNGILKEYYEDGKLKTESQYINDTIDGFVKVYYENGQIMSQTHFIKGKGKETQYFSNKGHQIILEGTKDVDSSFSWQDTILKPYTHRIVNIKYDLDGHCTVEPCYDTRDNHLIYDTLINFLKAHPSVEIEIASYFYRGSSSRNADGYSLSDNWSRLKANYMKRVLENKGINGDQIIPIGYGNKNPIFSESSIKKLPASEQWDAQHKNTRIDIIIIETGN